jgi:hypothetical protein
MIIFIAILALALLYAIKKKVARVKAERGIKRGPTPVEVAKPVPSAPTKGES